MGRAKRELVQDRKLNKKKVLIVITVLLVIIAIVLVVINRDKLFKSDDKEISNQPSDVKLENHSKEKTIEEILEEFGGEVIEQPKSDTYIVEKDEKEYTIYADGEIVEGRVSIWNGESKETPADEVGNYNIYTAEELKWVADKIINGEKNFSGVTLTLRANLDFGGRQKEDGTWEGTNWTAMVGFLDELQKEDDKNETDKNEVEEGKENLKRFAGCFDGNGFWIKGIYSNTEKKYQGLFGYSSGIIKNLTLKNSYISGKDVVGGIVGINGGTIENCRVENTIINGENKVGGITGVSMTSSTIKQGSTENCKIIGKNYIGGIVGYLNNNSSITESSNNADVSGEDYIGGVMGISFFGSNISTNSNSGNIKGNNYIGGIGGYSAAQIEKNINSGDITGQVYVGGLVGVNYTMGDINSSCNSGKVEGENNIGGVAGTNNASISNCYNKGNITAKDYRAGGICGQNATESYIYSSYNMGNVVGIRDFDGIAGGNFGTVTNSYYLEGTVRDGSPEQNMSDEDLKNNAVNLLGEDFVQDTENKNNGYPLLNWQ